MRRRLVCAAAVAAVALVLAGCGSRHPDAVPVTPAADTTVVDCTAEWDVGWGRIPDDFEPVEVYVCDPLLELSPRTDVDDQETGPTTSPEPQRLEGDLGPLVAAFDEPNDPPWPGPCTADMAIVPDVWLVDASGAAVRPAYPVTGCNKPKPAVGAALALLGPRG